MKSTNFTFGGMPVHIDDNVCIVPNYMVSQALHRTSPELARDLQLWCNEFFGAEHKTYTIDVGLARGGPKLEILVVSSLDFQKLRKELVRRTPDPNSLLWGV